MSTHSYHLRSRVNSHSPSLRPTPTCSPIPRAGARPISKNLHSSSTSLQLKRVIGTTTKDPNGLSCCLATKSYAYCAGSTAVFATINLDGSIKHRYFRAKPSAAALHPQSSGAETHSPITPTSRRRASLLGPKRLPELHQDDTPGKETGEEGGSQTWSARERIKTATCLSLSQDGRWLAVGEAGYNPRVLVFSTAEDAPTDIPVSIATEHGFGVRCVAFSPDLRWLATLGNHNDGYILIWSFNPKTGTTQLHSSNKCTSNICDMTWCGQNLITVGTRHVKVWQVAESLNSPNSRRSRSRLSFGHFAKHGPIPLQGRNCLLGTLVDNIFTSVTAISATTAVVATDTGRLCTFDVTQTASELRTIKEYPHSIVCLAYRSSSRQLVIGGPHGLCHERWSDLEGCSTPFATFSPSSSFRSSKRSRPSSIRQSLGLYQSFSVGVIAVGCMEELDVVLDNDGDLELHVPALEYRKSGIPSSASRNDAIQGLQSLPTEMELGMFYTWSRNGEINFWTADGLLLRREKIDLDQSEHASDPYVNELKCMSLLQSERKFITGDRYGLVKVIDTSAWQVDRVLRAHSAEVNCIAIGVEKSYVATCGRDRVVQLFQSTAEGFEFVQTMDDHVGAVTQVLFCDLGRKLLSCSVDRTILVRDWIQSSNGNDGKSGYLPSRIISTKSTPLCMTLIPDRQGHIFVSTTDRHVSKIDYQSGAILDSFKVADPATDDTVSLNSIRSSSICVNEGSFVNLLVGYSSFDKSIRIYDSDKGTLLSRESGHTEGISDLVLIEDGGVSQGCNTHSVVTTGLDGTIMIWSTISAATTSNSANQQSVYGLGATGLEHGSTPAKASPLSLPPLRKVLTRVELGQVPGFESIDASNAWKSRSRSLSPQRLQRKSSRLTLSETIEENNEDSENRLPQNKGLGGTMTTPTTREAPSPPLKVTNTNSTKIRSQPEVFRVSLSKSTDSIKSIGTETNTAANRGRLRRPPSMPADMRQHAIDQQTNTVQRPRTAISSKQEVPNSTKQTTEALRNFRKRFEDNYTARKVPPSEDEGLEDLEDEMVTILKMIQKRKSKAFPVVQQSEDSNKIEDLSMLLSRTKISNEGG